MNIKKIILTSISVVLCTLLVFFLHKISGRKVNSSICAISVDAATLAVESAYTPCDPVCTGYTPLMLAAMRGNLDDAKRLIADEVPLDTLSKDIDPSTESSNNFAMDNNTEAKFLHNTALHIAIYNTNFPSNFPVAQMLIDAGANVRIPNNRGDTPMHYIMQRIYRTPALDPTNVSEREDLMMNLIAHGADVNAQNNQGYTMLHIAVFDAEGEWIKTLLESYGSLVDFNAKAFETSCKSLTSLKSAPETNMSQEKCQNLTPLQLAGESAGSSLGSTYVRSILLNDSRSNPNVLEGNIKPKILGANERDVMGMTGFMLAVIWEGTQKLKNPSYNPSQDAHKDFTIEKLIQQADLNTTVNCLRNPCDPTLDLNNTVLHIALLHQLPDMIIKILDGAKSLGKKIDVNKQNVQGDAPLHYVPKLNALKLPIGSKIGNINEYNKKSREQVINYLIEYGGNINMQNNNGNTLLHLAVKLHATDLVNFLLQAYSVKNLKENQLINLSLRNLDRVQQGNVGKTALELAEGLNFTDIANAIQAAMPENQKLFAQPKNLQVDA